MVRFALFFAAVLMAGPAMLAQRQLPLSGARDGDAPVLLSNADGQSPYTGIGRYLGRASCTAVFVTMFDEGQGGGNAPAYALTNGHCPEFPGSNEVLLDRLPIRGQVIFNYFADTTSSQLSVAVTRVVYATMKGQDIAVLELALRHDQLRDRGVEPWPIARMRPAPDEPIAIIGAPGSSFLRLTACRLDGQAPLVIEYIWHWYGFFRNMCLGIQPGSSGSPAISRRTGEMVGLVNTSTSGGRPAFTECVLDHPCEPAVGGESGRLETNYVTPLLGVDACFPGGRFDVSSAGCTLDPGEQVRVTPNFWGRVNPRLSSVPLGRPVTHWNVLVSGPFERYRYKVASAGVDDCREPRGYTPPQSMRVRPIIEDALPEREGWHFLCVLGGPDPGTRGATQSAAFPTVVAVRVDSVRPRVPAPLVIEDVGPSWQVRFVTHDPEVSTYAYKSGRPAETRCEDGAGYRLALIPFISLPKSGRPYVFCAIPYDAALNAGRAIETLLP
jgi:hypothetical protein